VERKHWLPFTAILFTALLLRLWLAPMRGHVHDIEQLKAWTETAVTQNPLGIYTYSTANYPPLGLLPLWLVGHFYRAFFSPEFDTSSATLTALMKLPGIVADLVTAVILFCYLSREYGRQWGLVGMAAYALNPAILYNTAWWGQLESLVALPMLLAVLALVDGRLRWAWLWLALAVLVKPQAAVLGPVVLVGSVLNISREGAKRIKELYVGVGTGLVAGLIILMPFIVVGQLSALLAQIQASAGRQLFLTMNAHNFWYLVTLGRGSFAARFGDPVFDTEPMVGPLTGWEVGLVSFGVWVGYVCWRLWKACRQDAGAPFWAAGAMVIGFYMLPAEAHERYLFPAFVFLTLLLPLGRRFWVVYLGFMVTFFLNLVWVDSAVAWPSFSQILATGVPIAALNVGLRLEHQHWFSSLVLP
jgi:Gpi18-like mannosyltransferase